MNPTAQTGAPTKKKGNGVTTPSRRGGSGRMLTDVIVDLGFVEQATVDLAVDRANDNGSPPGRMLVARAAPTRGAPAGRRADRGSAGGRGGGALRPRSPHSRRLPRRPRPPQARRARGAPPLPRGP